VYLYVVPEGAQGKLLGRATDQGHVRDVSGSDISRWLIKSVYPIDGSCISLFVVVLLVPYVSTSYDPDVSVAFSNVT
jgi:hypothetical protein